MSKQLFELMRQQEIETSNFLPTKKEIIKNSESFITNLLDSGDYNKQELLAQAIRLSESLNTIVAKIKTSLPLENFESFGLKGTFKNGYDKLNYSDDEIYSDIQKELKEREELLKTAYKSNKEVYDEGGVIVTKVSSNPTKSSLNIVF